VRATGVALLALAATAPAAHAQQPLGVVEQTLGRFDRDTLAPLEPSLPVGEPHAAPVLSPAGDRLAMGVSAPATSRGAGGRVGLWIVDPARMKVLHAIRTGIAAEAVAFPGVVAALLQDGRLVVVGPATGAIVRDRRIGYSGCAPEAVEVGRTAVFVNQIRANAVEVTTVGARGRVRSARVAIEVASTGVRCRPALLVADPQRRRVLVVGAARVAAVDVATLRSRSHPIGDRGRDRSAALVAGSALAVAGERGLRLLDLRTWRTRWRDRAARAVLAAGDTVLGFGSALHARAAQDGGMLWRRPGRVAPAAIASGRVYVQSRTKLLSLDVATGREAGSRPPVLTRIRFVSDEEARLRSAGTP